MILDDYQKRVDQLFEQIKTTQRENIITAGKMIAETIDAGGNIISAASAIPSKWICSTAAADRHFIEHFIIS